MSEVSQGRGDPRLPAEDRNEKAAPRRPDQPGGQERPMTPDETLDEALEDTFPASDPVAPPQIDGPNN